MTAIVTTGNYVDFPVSGGADDRFVSDMPLTAGKMVQIASNLNHLGRQNSLKRLAGYANSFDTVSKDLRIAGQSNSFDWDGLAAFGAGTPFIWCGGEHFIYLYGEQGRFPKVTFTWKWKAPATYTLGAVCMVTPGLTHPRALYPYIASTTTNTTYTSKSVSVTIPFATPANANTLVWPGVPVTTAANPPEQGYVYRVGLFFGAWCTSAGGGNGSVAFLNVYLDEP